MQKQKIAVDVMGGDFGPSTTLPAVRLFLDKYPHAHIALFGPVSVVEPWIDCLPPAMKKSVTLHHSPDLIEPNASAREAMRKKHSSLRLALESLESGLSAAVVSSGQTGALMGLSKIILGTMHGISRPAIAKALPVLIPGSRKQSVMLDLGANIETSSRNLVEFAFLGEALYRCLNPGHDRPIIKLLNIGTEEKRGHAYIQEAGFFLSRSSLNYQGFIEPDKIFLSEADVIVSDGFSGNIALKTAEGLAKIFNKLFDSPEKNTNWLKSWFFSFCKSLVAKKIAQSHPGDQNGAFILGLKGIVIKSHGSASAIEFSKALDFAYQQIQGNILGQISHHLSGRTGVESFLHAEELH